jgi:RND family efflux transporter MFP subunit
MRKQWIWIGGGVIVTALLILGLLPMLTGAGPRVTAQETADFELVEAFVGDLSASATASGQVLPQKEALLTAETPATIDAVLVREGDAVAAGETLIQLDTAVLTLQVEQAELALQTAEANLAGLLTPATEADIAAAQASVVSAQATLDDLLDGPSEQEIIIAEAAVQSSQANVSSAAADLGSLQDSVSEAQIQSAQAALINAQIWLDAAVEANEESPNEANHQERQAAEQAVADAQATLNELLEGPDTRAAQASIASSAARLDGSELDLADTLDGATAVQIANAQTSLAQAEATLANLLDGASDETIMAAEAEVEQARLSLSDAQDGLDAATVTAPFDGVITAVYINEGELANGPLLEIVDVNSLEVVLEVDEVDVGQFVVGQAGRLSLETWPDTDFDSQIVRISPAAVRDANALVTYDVHLSLTDTNLPVRIGMTANANLFTDQREDILLVPNAAITPDRQAGTYSVTVQLADGSQQEVEVTIGLRDSEFTEITSGLQAGDQLVIRTAVPTVNPAEGANPLFGGGGQ